MAAQMEFHEAANIFPLDDEHIDELAKDIREQKQQVPIEIFDGKIIDGRRRYMACKIAGVEPSTRRVSPTDPIAYVLSLNLHRRWVRLKATDAGCGAMPRKARFVFNARGLPGHA